VRVSNPKTEARWQRSAPKQGRPAALLLSLALGACSGRAPRIAPARGTLAAGTRGDLGALVNAAERRLPAAGGKIIVPPGTYAYRVPIRLEPRVYLEGYGASLHYRGRDAAVRIERDLRPPYISGGLIGLTITGNPRALAGVLQVDVTGALYRDLAVWGFTGPGAAGVRVQNRDNGYDERTVFDRVSIGDCSRDLEFSNRGGTDSAGYTRIALLHLQVGNGQTGILVAGPRLRLYNSEVDVDITEFLRPRGQPGTAIRVTNGARVTNDRFTIFGENAAGTGNGIGLSLGGRSAWEGWGVMHWSNLTDKIAPGATFRVRP
jgi:hypothetical protein